MADVETAAARYRVTFERIGRRGGRGGSEPPAPLTARVADADELAHEIRTYALRFLGSRDPEVQVDLEEGSGVILCGWRSGGTFTIEQLADRWFLSDCEGCLEIWREDVLLHVTRDESGEITGYQTPGSYRPGDLIAKWELNTWDRGEDPDDDKRRAIAESMVRDHNEVERLRAELKRAKEIERQRDHLRDRWRDEHVLRKQAEAERDRQRERAPSIETLVHRAFADSDVEGLDLNAMTVQELTALVMGAIRGTEAGR